MNVNRIICQDVRLYWIHLSQDGRFLQKRLRTRWRPVENLLRSQAPCYVGLLQSFI